MPLIIPSNTITGGYEVDNSLRFDEASGDYLSKASFGTPTSTRKSTISFWCKRSLIEEGIIFMNDTATFPIAKIYFDSSHRFSYIEFDPSIYIARTTNAVFRDVSAWYHIVVAIDTEQATADDRVKVYINGVQETSFATSTTPAQNTDLIINDNLRSAIGGSSSAGTDIFEGYIAEIIRVDGQALDPTSFGEFDADTGIWKPIDVSGLTFGTNGFYLPFENSAALGQDDSGNGNNFTVNNLTSIDQTTDTPTNNFATGNPLTNTGTLSEGNLKVVTDTVLNDLTTASTIHVSQGKWYAEFKCTATSGSTNFNIGIAANPSENIRASNYIGQSADSYGVLGSNGNFYNNGSGVSYMNSFTAGDIIGVALDLDNNFIYFSKNGVWQNSGDPESGSSGTGGKAITAASSQSTGVYAFAVGDASTADSMTFEVNFGNPSFTISSGNSDANGYGQFEYLPPSGYLALCTANLATDG